MTMQHTAPPPRHAISIPLGAGSLLLPPDAGAPPVAPIALGSLLTCLQTLPPRRLSPDELLRWVAEQAHDLSLPDRAALLQYTAACAAWADHFFAEHRRWGDSRDFTTRPAANARLNSYELRLGQALASAGLPVEAQVGVSKNGGSRRGGWYGSYWLDFAHRDPAHALLLDIELDGRHHHSRAMATHDALRNDRLRRRGWSVVRIPSAALQHHLALQEIGAALVDYAACHCQAIILGRISVDALADAFSLRDGIAPAMRRPAMPEQPWAATRSAREQTVMPALSVPVPPPPTLPQRPAHGLLRLLHALGRALWVLMVAALSVMIVVLGLALLLHL